MSNQSPLYVQQVVTLKPNQDASVSLLDNLVRFNWDLREVRIAVVPVDANGAPANPSDQRGNNLDLASIFGLASMVDFGLRLQSTYLSVPRRVPAELLRSPYFDSLSEPEDPNVLSTIDKLWLLPQRSIIWTFPEPLFVPAGGKMYAELFWNAAEGANSFMWEYLRVQVTLIGNRTTRSPPAKTKVPYATTYRTPKEEIGQDGHVQSFQAQDFQLKNHNKENLFVQRLTAYNTAADRIPTSIRYSDSQNRFINRDLVPLLELHSNGALNLHTVLAPNEFLAVEGEIDSTPARLPAGEDDPQIPSNYEQQAMFGLLGYREVDTEVLWGPIVRLAAGVGAPQGEAGMGEGDPLQVKAGLPRGF